jgi:CDP-paratose synthetase
MQFQSMDDKTILITGGTGFLGSNLLQKLVETNATIIVLKRPQSKLFRLNSIINKLVFYNINEVSLESIFKIHTIHIVIHCATTYGSQLKNIPELIESNLVLPLSLLELCMTYKKPVFINTDTILDKRISVYSLAKKQFYDWLKLFSLEMPCINVSLEHFYGPLDDRTKFCSKMIMDLLTEVPKIDLTPGLQKRDFIYIDDVVSAFMKIIEYSLQVTNGFYHFEVGTGKNLSIKSFIELLSELTNNKKTKLNFGALNYRPNETMEYQVDLRPIQSLGWQPRYNLIDGLRETIKVEKNYLEETV